MSARVTASILWTGALLLGVGQARAWDGELDASTIFQAYEVRSPGTTAVITRRRLLETLGVEWTDALADRPDGDGRRPRLTVSIRLRIGQELGDTCLVARELCIRATDPTQPGTYQPLAQDTNIDLPTAMAEVSELPLGLSIRAGRQLIWDAIGFARVDGGRVRAEPFPWLGLEALGGQLVTDSSLGGASAFELAGLPRLALPSDAAMRAYFIAPPIAAFTAGGAVELGRTQWVRGRVSFRQTWTPEATIAQRLATSLVSSPIPELRLSLDSVWELSDATLVDGVASVTASPLPQVAMTLRAARHVPRFDPGTIWAYFAVAPITEGELSATFRPTDRADVTAAVRVRHADLGVGGQGHDATLRGDDVDWGGEGRAAIRLGILRLAGSGFVWSGSLGPTAGVLFDGDLRVSPEVTLEAAASVWYFDDPLRTELYGITVSEMVGARWRLGSTTTLMAELDHATSRVVGNRFRAMLAVAIEVWR